MSYEIEHNKNKITLPSFSNLPVGVIRKARKLEPDDQMWFMLESILDEKSLDVIDTMSLSEFYRGNERLDTGCTRGGILEVLQILEDYKHAFTYDFRARFIVL